MSEEPDQANEQEDASLVSKSGPINESPIHKPKDEKPPVSIHKAATAVVFYWCISLTLVFVNKLVMSGDFLQMDAPLFLTWTQFVVTCLCCVFLSILNDIVYKNEPQNRLYDQMEYDFTKARKILPLTFVFLGMIIFNNLCLKYVEISFYQVARSLTILFNLVLSTYVLGNFTSHPVKICCAIVVTGYLLGCDAEVHFSTHGVIYGVLSSFFVALNAVVVKRTLAEVVSDSSDKLILYNNLNAALILPFIIFFLTDEFSEVQNKMFVITDGKFWATIVGAGVCGFLINFASYIQIKFTSPLSHNISGTAKAAAQTIIALVIYGNPMTMQGYLGIFLVLAGSSAYSYARMTARK